MVQKASQGAPPNRTDTMHKTHEDQYNAQPVELTLDPMYVLAGITTVCEGLETMDTDNMNEDSVRLIEMGLAIRAFK